MRVAREWVTILFGHEWHIFDKETRQLVIKDEVLLMVSYPIFPSILIAKNLLTGSLNKNYVLQW